MVDMILSVQERKRNVHNFINAYPYLCKLYNVVPSTSIKIDSSNFVLDIYGDRLKIDDWKPVFEAISNDRRLHSINIRSKHSITQVVQDIEAEGQGKHGGIGTPKSPLFTRSVVLKIIEALSKCLTNSPSLTGVLIEKIPLTGLLAPLTQGLEMCQNLQQLALPYTHLGDDDCIILCHVLRHRLSVVWLNLTGCGLTDRGVSALCNLLKFQKLSRYGESWKQSLRYRPVNPNIMPGLRRLTLNSNPIGDTGVKIFVETLVDDLWLKALDLQHCNITAAGGEALLNLVEENENLLVVDVRGNTEVPTNIIGAIVQLLSQKSSDTTPEFQWLKDDNKWKSRRGGSISTCSGRHTFSSTTLSNRVLTAATLSNKTSFCLPKSLSSKTKRNQATFHTSQLPWNYNSSSTVLRRGKSEPTNKINNPDTLKEMFSFKRKSESTNNCNTQDVLREIHSFKEQMHDFSKKFDEERERIMKLEKKVNELNVNLPDDCSAEERLALQSIFSKLCEVYFESKGKSDVAKNDTLQVEKICTSSLESVIRTMNRNTTIEPNQNENNPGVFTFDSSDNQGNIQDTPFRAQLLFKNLISNVTSQVNRLDLGTE